MPRSIARRIHRTVFTISLICLAVTGGLIYFANEDMEQTMLSLDYQAERSFLLDKIGHDQVLTWHTANLRAFYVPAHQVDQLTPPPLFQGLPIPFSGEIEVTDQTYLITIDAVEGGRLYLANNITLFEHQETLFAIILAIIFIGVIVLGFVLARISSRRLVVPLRQLAGRIGSTPPGRNIPRMPQRFEDEELATIATTFNTFLDEMEAYVKREQSLLGLASHELRTPIAIIAGALDVIQQRDQLSEDDRRTLERARRANAEMGVNVDMILKLARHKDTSEAATAIDLPELVRELLTDLESTTDARRRVVLDVAAPATLVTDPVFVKMLLRNLIQNAIQHTTEDLCVRIARDHIEITDHGDGLPEPYQRLLTERTMPAGELTALSGLGLFIVTLICERLEWCLDIPHSSERGTTLLLQFSTSRE